MPSSAKMSPIVADDAPCSWALTTSTMLAPPQMKFAPATPNALARMNAMPHSQRTPSAISASGRRGAASRVSCSGVRSASRPSAHTRYETASTAKGSARPMP